MIILDCVCKLSLLSVITGNHSPGSVDDSTGERKASYRIIRLFVVITLVHWMCPPCVSVFSVSRRTFPCRSRGGRGSLSEC